MNETFYIVIIDTGGSDYEIYGFDSEELANDFAGVRGGDALVQVVSVMGERDAKRLIDAEAKERRDEERFERMRQEGEI